MSDIAKSLAKGAAKKTGSQAAKGAAQAAKSSASSVAKSGVSNAAKSHNPLDDLAKKKSVGDSAKNTLAGGSSKGVDVDRVKDAAKSGLNKAKSTGASIKNASQSVSAGTSGMSEGQSLADAEAEGVQKLKDEAKQIGKDAGEALKDTAMGAAQGAATGGLVGAGTGALKGVAKGIIKTKTGRKVIVIVLALALLTSPTFWMAGALIVASSAISGDDSQQESTSNEQAKATGVDDDTLAVSAKVGNQSQVPRQILASLQFVSNGGSFSAAGIPAAASEGGGGGAATPSEYGPANTDGGLCPAKASEQVEKAIKPEQVSPDTRTVARCAWMIQPSLNNMLTLGSRPNKSDHPMGYAVDIMIPNYKETTADGDAVAAMLQANYKALNINYIIWDARIWSSKRDQKTVPLREWRNYTHPTGGGGDTLLHKDHVHVSVNHDRRGGEVTMDGIDLQAILDGARVESGGSVTPGTSGGTGSDNEAVQTVSGTKAEGVGPYKLDLDEIEKRAREDEEYPVITEKEAEDLEASAGYLATLIRNELPSDVQGRNLDDGSHLKSLGNGKTVRAIPVENTIDKIGRKMVAERMQEAWVETLKELPVGNIDANAEPIFTLARLWALGVPPASGQCTALPVSNAPKKLWVNPFKGEKIGLDFGGEFTDDSETKRITAEGDTHQGVDFRTEKDAEVKVIAKGTVVSARGVRMVIDHGNDVESIYAVIKDHGKKPGDQLEAGDVLGTVMGDTVHFQINEKGQPVDPLMFMSSRGITVGAGEQGTDEDGGDEKESVNLGDSLTAEKANGEKITLDKEQLDLASQVITAGRSVGADDRALIIAFMTILQESTLKNLDRGHLDSVGLFQQRPSSGWGTKEQLQDVEYTTKAFFGGPDGPNDGDPPGLFDVDGWESMTPGEAAQAVQVSAHPDLYDQWQPVAEKIVGTVTGTASCSSDEWGAAGFDGKRATEKAWGGYSNGEIPLETMRELLPDYPGHLMRCDAADNFMALAKKYKEDTGKTLGITSTYRSLEKQREIKASKGGLAATPGRSTHGWGLAVDISVGGRLNFGGAVYQWLDKNAGEFGWENPSWARKGGSLSEAWHWEYIGEWDGRVSCGAGAP